MHNYPKIVSKILHVSWNDTRNPAHPLKSDANNSALFKKNTPLNKSTFPYPHSYQGTNQAPASLFDFLLVFSTTMRIYQKHANQIELLLTWVHPTVNVGCSIPSHLESKNNPWISL